ncbi:NADH dehydrogenase [ubiquinone] 1 beta subcomplex subunit 1 [Protopterus annectens]|uniref:NADH dehydrogenase [ubiquinone] 1 beta subcomplex subunit 1 n=1 Tax=Protopterus annectens TaxID=7888 RepID=UPI001CFBBBDC|nr:NADH dehydrogenase [ubiquinone] 1 beta subcomplex subunit 1 [Protopterus annectens]
MVYTNDLATTSFIQEKLVVVSWLGLKLFRNHCSKAIMVNLVGMVREHWAAVLVPLGFVIGWYWDRKNDEKLTAFRNKSVLYHRELKPGEEVTWK